MTLLRYEWDPRLSVHSKEIDKQHRGLLRIMNDLHFAMLQGKGRVKVVDLLHDLNVFATEHFSYEEKHMLQMAYPGIKEQKEMHVYFLSQIHEFMAQTDSNSISLPINVMKFLKEWLVHHISVEDKKYAVFSIGHSPGPVT